MSSFVSFLVGLFVGNLQAYGSRANRDQRRIERALDECGIGDEVEVIHNLRGDIQLIGTVDSVESFDRLKLCVNENFNDLLFDGISVHDSSTGSGEDE